MENTEYLATDRLRISPRAYALALQNHVDILRIVPTGPEGRIIENDILRAIEERNKPKAEENATASQLIEKKAMPEPAEAAEAAESAVTEEAKITDNPIEEAPVEENTENSENITENDEISAENSEKTEEIRQNDEKAEIEEAQAEEIHVIEENSEKAEENGTKTAENDIISEEIETNTETVEEVSETAIVTAPVTAMATEETEEESQKEEQQEKTFRSEDAYRHTDVIIPQSDKVTDSTPITMEMSFDATAIMTLRSKIKENGEQMNVPSVTINDMILFAVSKTLKKHKALNAHFLEDKIRYFDGIHLGFAVDTERGPQTVTVFDADRLSLSSLSKITGALVRGIRAGVETPEKNLRMGSFTVTNVGTLGVERFTPVLTAPQTGVLGVSALTKRIKTIDGEDIVYPCIPLALTFDPRAMSTANAAKYLRDLCLALENFDLLLIK